jgi:hypothetical protein
VSKAERAEKERRKLGRLRWNTKYNNPSKPWISMGKKASVVIDLFSEIICVGGDGLVDEWVGGWMGAGNGRKGRRRRRRRKEG